MCRGARPIIGIPCGRIVNNELVPLAAAQGSVAEQMEVFRSVRDDIEGRLREWPATA